MIRRTLQALALGLFTAAAPVAIGAHAGYHGFNVDDVAQFEILPGWRTESGTRMTALRVTLAPGWKTYWRAPGEAGIPPRFDWGGSRNLRAVRFLWPAPEVFEENGMRSVGYTRALVLPIELTPKQTGQGIRLRAAVEIGVCEDICIPVNVRLSAELDGAGQPDGAIQAAIAARPDTAREAGLRDIACRVDALSDGLRLTARIQMPRLGPGEIAVFELPDQEIWVAEAATERKGGTLTAVTELVPPRRGPFALDRSEVRITVLAAGRAVDIQGCPRG